MLDFMYILHYTYSFTVNRTKYFFEFLGRDNLRFLNMNANMYLQNILCENISCIISLFFKEDVPFVVG